MNRNYADLNVGISVAPQFVSIDFVSSNPKFKTCKRFNFLRCECNILILKLDEFKKLIYSEDYANCLNIIKDYVVFFDGQSVCYIGL